jgi:hypothetical protein
LGSKRLRITHNDEKYAIAKAHLIGTQVSKRDTFQANVTLYILNKCKGCGLKRHCDRAILIA